ncbi:MAG: hypothetical protein D6729_17920, partial [Deltaproteobacteria bacterium]
MLLVPLALAALACTRDFTLPGGEDEAIYVQGRVVVAEGTTGRTVPAPGAHVSVLRSNLNTQTDEAGRFLLGPLPPDHGDLWIRYGAGSVDDPLLQRLVPLPETASAVQAAIDLGEVALLENAVVSGRVLRDDAASASRGHGGISVYVPEAPFHTFTGDDGTFRLDAIPPGTITVEVYTPGYEQVTLGPIELRSGEFFTTRTLRLSPTEGSEEVKVRGQLRLEPPPAEFTGATVLARKEGEETPLGVEADGSYGGTLPLGLYDFFFAYPGYGGTSLHNVLVVPLPDGGPLVLPEVTLEEGQSEPPPPPEQVVPPTAAIDAPTVAGAGTTLRFDASASTVQEGHALSYAWRQLEGPPLVFSRNDGPQAIWTEVVLPLDPARFTVELTVRDLVNGERASAVHTLETHAPPVAMATAPAQVVVGERVTLDASASVAPGGHTLAYAWRQSAGEVVVLSRNDAPEAVTTDFVAPSWQQTLVFALTVTDLETGLASTSRVEVQVIMPPVAQVAPVEPVPVGSVVRLDASASTASLGSALLFYWTQTGGTPVTLLDADEPVAAAMPTFQAPDAPDLLTFDLVVEDALTGLTDATSVAVAVLDPPVARIVPDTLVVPPGQTVRFDGSTSLDPGGAPLSYAWQVAGPDVSVVSPTLDGPTLDVQAGTEPFAVTLEVSTPLVTSLPASVTVQVDPSVILDPVLTPPGDQLVQLGEAVTLAASAHHPDPSATLTFTWAQVQGTPVAFVESAPDSSSSRIVFTAPNTPATLEFTVAVDDTQGGHAEARVVVEVSDQDPPVLVTSDPRFAGATGPWLRLWATFDEPLDPASVNSGTVWLEGPDGLPRPATVDYDPATYTISLWSDVPLIGGGQHVFHIGAVTDLAPQRNAFPGVSLPFYPRAPNWQTSVSADQSPTIAPQPGVALGAGEVWVVGRRDDANCGSGIA